MLDSSQQTDDADAGDEAHAERATTGGARSRLTPSRLTGWEQREEEGEHEPECRRIAGAE
jgi:hypothetical protein